MAGISIVTLTGNNGIITKASEAKIKTRVEQVKEQVNLWNAEKEMAKQTNTVGTSEEEFLQNLKDSGIVNENEIDRQNQILIIEGEEIYYGGSIELTDIYVAIYTDGTLVFNNKNEFDESMLETNYGNIKDKDYSYEENRYAPWYDERKDILKIVFLSRVVPSSTASWFYQCINLKIIDNLNYLKVDKVTDMSDMFLYCEQLEKIDVSTFNTSNVTDMSYMFGACNVLSNVDVSKFDTSNVTDMNAMFTACHVLSNLDVSKFDTSKVTNMSYMFYGVSNLNGEITIKGNIDISDIDNYEGMFDSAATNLDSKFVVNYIKETSSIVDTLIDTKSENSNVIKGKEINLTM